jgi:type IX secretion system PorP/SprF family membrane protein
MVPAGRYVCGFYAGFKVKLLLSLLLFILINLATGVRVAAQDPHFSQFYASPLTLNPAIAGTYTGTFRISTLYRDQWRAAIDTPLRTFAMSGDVKFDVKVNAKNLPDAIGLGITFFGDRVATFDYNTNQILLSAAYHKVLDRKYRSTGWRLPESNQLRRSHLSGSV